MIVLKTIAYGAGTPTPNDGPVYDFQFNVINGSDLSPKNRAQVKPSRR